MSTIDRSKPRPNGPNTSAWTRPLDAVLADIRARRAGTDATTSPEQPKTTRATR